MIQAVSRAILAVGILSLVACQSSNTVERGDVRHVIQIDHGTVQRIDQVEVESQASKGAVIGGLSGLAYGWNKSGKARVGGAIGGAVAGALLTRLLEGSNKANAYTIILNNGRQEKIVTEQTDIRVGDCVSIEVGTHANLRHVSSALCEPAKAHPLNSDIEVDRRNEAAECHEAKQQLLQAKSDADIEASSRKVRVLCHH